MHYIVDNNAHSNLRYPFKCVIMHYPYGFTYPAAAAPDLVPWYLAAVADPC